MIFLFNNVRSSFRNDVLLADKLKTRADIRRHRFVLSTGITTSLRVGKNDSIAKVHFLAASSAREHMLRMDCVNAKAAFT